MKPARLLAANLLALSLFASVATAETMAFRIDPNHSRVGFTIRHFFTRVSGNFREFSGRILYDDKQPENSQVNVEIKTASIFTNNDRRDNDLRSAHFFSADSFPVITFKSTKVTRGEGDKLKIEGNLDMHGVSKPVTLDASFLGSGATGMGGGPGMGVRAGWSATTTIDRKQWGILWNQTLDQGGTMLGDDVQLQLDVEAAKESPEGAKSPAAAKK
jgi:polyisoprenoid-binding protein YceI